MKKIAVIVLMLCYLVPSFGFSVTTHYCGGHLTSVSFNTGNNGKCACGSKDKNKPCCKDKVCFIKVKNIPQTSSQYTIDFSQFSASKQVVASAVVFNPFISSCADLTCNSHSPPLLARAPLFLLNRVFRI